MSADPNTARQLRTLIEPLHSQSYFAPEPIEALKAAGYRGYWMCYFAGRAAPLGAVPPEVVVATFFNFSAAHVRKALPDAWTFAPPSVAGSARLGGAIAALNRAFGGADVSEAAALVRRAAEAAPIEGRILAAAISAQPWPDDPVGELWHGATLLREHRGDGHIAALVAAGISGRESNVLYSAAGGPSKAVYGLSRQYDDAEWAANVASLAARGLLAADGTITAAGKALRDDVEERTDRLAASAYAGFDAADIDRLVDVLRPLAAAVHATGDLPDITPMGRI